MVKKKTTRSEVFMKIKGELSRIGVKRIILLGKGKGVLEDGREVIRRGKRWIYRAR